MESAQIDNISKSHEAHKKHFEKFLQNEREQRLFTLRNKDNVEYKINIRTLDILAPFLHEQSSWLTIGDYNGFEAKYLLDKGQRVVASDISNSFLNAAKEEGLIQDVSQQNVEQLTYDSGAFNYVMCREAYHHFPRAYMGAYEMMRVANKAAIIIEPIDIIQKMPVMLFLKNVMDLFNPFLINKIWKNRFSFEIVGNYVFKISEREVEKMAMGIGLPCIAFKRINVVMEQLGEGVKDTPYNKVVWKKFQRKVTIKNLLAKLHIIPYNTLCCVIFKEMPSPKQIMDMKNNGYEILPLPKNPYLK